MTHQKPLFHLIATGGTIDSFYDVNTCQVVCHRETVLPTYLINHMGIDESSFVVTRLAMKDSREIDEADRTRMAEAIRASDCSNILITHGSFTIFETARRLAEHPEQKKPKTIVLTGSLRPLDGFSPTDAPFNLGAAIIAAQLAPAGIYVCIEGRLYAPDERQTWHRGGPDAH